MTSIMRTNFQILVLLIICYSCSRENIVNPKNCEELKANGVIDSFPYPIRPGSDEWKNLKTQVEKYEVLNVPEDVLQNMCTHGLVYTCVYCPFFFQLTVFNNIRSGFISLTNNINSYAELTDRYDSGQELFDYYKTLFDTTWNCIKQIGYQVQILHSEIFFAQQEYLSKLTNQELKEVLIEIYNKLLEKETHNLDKYCINGSLYLLSNILYYNMHYKPLIDFIDRNNLIYFLNDLMLFNFNTDPTDSLKYYSVKYIQEFIQ